MKVLFRYGTKRTLKMFKNDHEYEQNKCQSKETVELSQMAPKLCKSKTRNGQHNWADYAKSWGKNVICAFKKAHRDKRMTSKSTRSNKFGQSNEKKPIKFQPGS